MVVHEMKLKKRLQKKLKKSPLYLLYTNSPAKEQTKSIHREGNMIDSRIQTTTTMYLLFENTFHCLYYLLSPIMNDNNSSTVLFLAVFVLIIFATTNREGQTTMLSSSSVSSYHRCRVRERCVFLVISVLIFYHANKVHLDVFHNRNYQECSYFQTIPSRVHFHYSLTIPLQSMNT